MRKQAYILAVLCCLTGLFGSLQAQQKTTKAYARVTESGQSICVRWENPDLSGTSAVNIYRQEKGKTDWLKLNDTPWKRGEVSISDKEKEEDKALSFAVSSADAYAKDPNAEGAGFLKMMMVTQMIVNHKFAQYLAIEFEDETAQSGIQYKYQVRAIKGADEKEIGTSEYVKAGKFIRMAPLEIIASEAVDGITKLSYHPDPNVIFAANIYRAEKGGPRIKVNEVPVLLNCQSDGQGGFTWTDWSFQDTSVSNGTVYNYEVNGLDLFGFETVPSQQLFLQPVDLTPPTAPTNFEMEISDGIARMTWEASKATDLAGYNVLRRIPQDKTGWEVLNKKPLPIGTFEYQDKVPTINRLYTYKIVALDQVGNEGASKEKTQKVYDRTAPKIPVDFTVEATSGKVILSWKANQEGDLAGYRIYRGLSQEKGKVVYNLLNVKPITEPTFSDELPKEAKNKFLYQISAIDTIYNESEPTASKVAEMPDVIAPDPAFLQKVRSLEGTIELTWIPSTAEDVVEYKIYRKADTKEAQWERLNTNPIDPSVKTYLDKTPQSGQEYFYVVTALDKTGNESAYSNQYKASTVSTTYKVQAKLTKAEWNKRKKGVLLQWEVPQDENLLGCMVYRMDDSKKWRPVSALLTDTGWQDKKTKEGNSYTYEIRAFNTEGVFSKSAPALIQTPSPTK